MLFEADNDIAQLCDAFPPGFGLSSCSVADSGKLHVLFHLVTLLDAVNEKCVVASHSTNVLRLLEALFTAAEFRVFCCDKGMARAEKARRLEA